MPLAAALVVAWAVGAVCVVVAILVGDVRRGIAARKWQRRWDDPS